MREVKRLRKDAGIGVGSKVRMTWGTVIGEVLESYPHAPGLTVKFGNKLYEVWPQEVELI